MSLFANNERLAGLTKAELIKTYMQQMCSQYCKKKLAGNKWEHIEK